MKRARDKRLRSSQYNISKAGLSARVSSYTNGLQIRKTREGNPRLSHNNISQGGSSAQVSSYIITNGPNVQEDKAENLSQQQAGLSAQVSSYTK